MITNVPFRRNPALELFRCILMFLIVLGHSWGEGPFSPSNRIDKYVEWWEFITIGMLIWHVDGFISISGWFGIKFTWKKFFYLLGTIAFYTIVKDIVKYCSATEAVSVGFAGLNGGWFGSNYIVLMMSAPFVNAAVDSLCQKSKRGLLFAWILLGVAFFLTWAPAHFFTGINAMGFGHQTYAMMLFVYLTARIARKSFEKVIPLRVLLGGVLLYLMVVIGFGVFLNLIGNTSNPMFWKIWGLLLVNHAPMVYMVALVFLLIFAWHIHLPECAGRIILRVSPTMFGVYLCHGTILLPVEKWIACNFMWHPLIAMIVSTLFAYVISIAFDLLRLSLVNVFRRRIDSGLQAIDDMWSRLSGGLGK